jgi:hypothetical protein
MATYTVEVRQIYDIEVKAGEDWADVLDKALQTYYTTGVEADQVTLINHDVEIITEPDESEN